MSVQLSIKSSPTNDWKAPSSITWHQKVSHNMSTSAMGFGVILNLQPFWLGFWFLKCDKLSDGVHSVLSTVAGRHIDSFTVWLLSLWYAICLLFELCKRLSVAFGNALQCTRNSVQCFQCLSIYTIDSTSQLVAMSHTALTVLQPPG